MYYRARYYNPGIGRFVSEDPLRYYANGFVEFGQDTFRRFVLLLAALVLLGVLTPYVSGVFQSYSNPIRILIAIALLLPAGLGMAFPLGMKLATGEREPIKPWLWRINGATSVCASVLAVVIALSFGISAAF